MALPDLGDKHKEISRCDCLKARAYWGEPTRNLYIDFHARISCQCVRAFRTEGDGLVGSAFCFRPGKSGSILRHFVLFPSLDSDNDII